MSPTSGARIRAVTGRAHPPAPSLLPPPVRRGQGLSAANERERAQLEGKLSTVIHSQVRGRR